MSASSLLLAWLACICTSLASAYVVTGTSLAAAEAEAKAAEVLLPPPSSSLPPSRCLDTCVTAGDAICQDGGWGASGVWCEFGTDCADCGPRLVTHPPPSPLRFPPPPLPLPTPSPPSPPVPAVLPAPPAPPSSPPLLSICLDSCHLDRHGLSICLESCHLERHGLAGWGLWRLLRLWADVRVGTDCSDCVSRQEADLLEALGEQGPLIHSFYAVDIIFIPEELRHLELESRGNATR